MLVQCLLKLRCVKLAEVSVDVFGRRSLNSFIYLELATLGVNLKMLLKIATCEISLGCAGKADTRWQHCTKHVSDKFC